MQHWDSDVEAWEWNDNNKKTTCWNTNKHAGFEKLWYKKGFLKFIQTGDWGKIILSLSPHSLMRASLFKWFLDWGGYKIWKKGFWRWVLVRPGSFRPWNIFKIEVLRSGMSDILRPSQCVIIICNCVILLSYYYYYYYYYFFFFNFFFKFNRLCQDFRVAISLYALQTYVGS